jgi:hypothetical protein
LWRDYVGDEGYAYLDYEQFEHRLRSDKRLYVTPGPSSPMPATQEEMLRQMGFPLRAMIGLADRKPPQAALDNAAYAKALQLQQALLKLWQARPQGDAELEDRLKRLLEEVRRLCGILKPACRMRGPQEE